MKTKSLYNLEMLANKHPVMEHNISEEQRSLLCLQIYLFLVQE